MIVFHAAGAPDGIWLWAEASPEEEDEAAARKGTGTDTRQGSSPRTGPRKGLAARGRSRNEPLPFPFDPGPGQLLEALARAAGGFQSDAERARSVVGWMPVRGRRPIPSTPLVAPPPRGPGRIRLRPWALTAIRLDREEALTLLATARGRRLLGRGLSVGADLSFWTEAVAFAARLVQGRHVVPALVGANGRKEARWDPVLVGPDLESLARLARTMPPVARALVPGASTTAAVDAGPPDTSPLALVRGFIGDIADHLVRSAQWPDGILPHPGEEAWAKGGWDRTSSRQAGSGTVDERWLAALRAPDPVVDGDPAELADLGRRLEEWRRPMRRVLDAAWRLCFRLEEPEDAVDAPAPGEDGADSDGARGVRWRLRFLLQDLHDPSLMLPLERAWAPDDPEARAFPDSHRERLLETLGQAARLSPRVAESLDAPVPGGASLDPAEAYTFLREEAPLLREAGFGVQLPAWWTRGRDRLRPSVRAVATPIELQASSGLDLRSLVEVRWEVLLADEAISPAELEELARLKAPLVRFRDRWVEVDPDELRRILADLGRVKSDRVEVSRLVRMALGAEDGPRGLRVEEVRAEGFLGELVERLRGDAEFRVIPPPHGLQAALRPYQEKGYSWLAFLARWGLGACLADDMGLGKTVQTLALVQRDREVEGEVEPAAREPAAVEAGGDAAGAGGNGARDDTRGSTAGPVLVVCPTSVVTNWAREAARFAPELRVQVHHGPDRPRAAALARAAAGADLVVTTYALLQRDADDLAAVSWRGLVLDEAQNIKNPDTLRARAARSLSADYRVALTGTPVENHVGDLWSIIELLNPGLLGSRASFRERFFLPIQTRRDGEAARRLRRITGPFVLRRLKTDRTVIRDLPERIDMRAYCPLTREQASLYRAVVKELEEALEGAEGIQRKGLVLATLTRLKQVCNHPAHFLNDGSAVAGRSGKVERLVEILEEALAAGGRVLVFTQFTRMGEILQRHLQETFGDEVPFLHGGVSRGRREEMVDRFQAPQGPGIFLLSLKAGGTGLNLTAANHVLLFDRWWNPAVESQATDRAFRIGQTRNVQVHRFVCTGTLEEQIDRMIEEKREVARSVVGTGEGWLTELSDDALREVLAFRGDTDGEA